MEGTPLILYLVLALAAIIQAGLFAFQAFENRRFTRARCRREDKGQPSGHVLLIAPCKGNDIGLRENLNFLLAQDYADYEVRFVVESENDPAVAVIEQIIRNRRSVRTSLAIAGAATDCGQKVHNLRAATEKIPPETEYLAFVDSDARPNPHWLRWLISRLEGRKVGAVSGYRWFVPVRQTLPNFILSSINANVAGLLGPGNHHFVWGGSWAILRGTFEAIGLRDAWQGTLSDDLVATRVLRKHKLGVEFEPRCLVSSSLDAGFGQVFEFLRRQYLIGRVYTPLWWLGAVLVSMLATVVLWTSVIAAAIGLSTGAPLAWLPASVAGLLWGSHTFRAWLRQDMAWHALPDFRWQLKSCRRFDYWAAPLAGVINLLGLCGSMFGNTIAWRGIRYRLFRGGLTRRLTEGSDERAGARNKLPRHHWKDHTKLRETWRRIA